MPDEGSMRAMMRIQVSLPVLPKISVEVPLDQEVQVGKAAAMREEGIANLTRIIERENREAESIMLLRFRMVLRLWILSSKTRLLPTQYQDGVRKILRDDSHCLLLLRACSLPLLRSLRLNFLLHLSLPLAPHRLLPRRQPQSMSETDQFQVVPTLQQQ